MEITELDDVIQKDMKQPQPVKQTTVTTQPIQLYNGVTETLFGLRIKVYPTKEGTPKIFLETFPMGAARQFTGKKKKQAKKNQLKKVKVEEEVL